MKRCPTLLIRKNASQIQNETPPHAGQNDHYKKICCYCCCLVTKLCPTLWDPMDCSPQGSSVHGISHARILQWVVISFTRGSSWPRDQTCISSWQADSLPLSHLGSPIKKFANNKCCNVCGGKGTLLHCYWECKFVPSLWRTVWRFPWKTKVVIQSSNPIPGQIFGKDKNSNLKRYMHLQYSQQHYLQ